MSPYALIDPHLVPKAEDEGWELHTEWAGSPARYFHIWGTPPWDCFQISVEHPVGEEVSLLARSLDTNDEQELEATFSGAVSDFERLLAKAVEQVEVWKRRA